MPQRSRLTSVTAQRNGVVSEYDEQYRSINALATQLGISRRHLIDMLAREGAPTPLKISSRCVRYPLRETIEFFRGTLTSPNN